jgi:hypothetical protein
MTTNGALSGMGGEELRAVVRAVLRDVLPAAALEERAGGRAAPLERAEPSPETVALGSDAELQAFVSHVAALCEDPRVRADLRAGRRPFRLAGARGGATLPAGAAPANASRAGAAPLAPVGGSVVRVEHGAVTERTVVRAAADGCRLVLGRRAVLTPLARDKARVLGVRIEKER